MRQFSGGGFGFGRPWTPAVKGLIIANFAVFLLQWIDRQGLLEALFALDTARVLFMPWQFLTYLFLHGGGFHLFFNMFALWMFGSEMEEFFGRKEFLFYYFMTGTLAGVCVWLTDLLGGGRSLTVGASGAVFGILVAYGIVHARRPITLLLFLVVPVTLPARTFVIGFALLELVLGMSPGGSTVAHFAHLGGMAAGYLYFKFLRASIRPYFYGRGLLSDLAGRLKARSGMNDQERLNQLLDKINRYGIHTLTDGEREFLDRMSRRRFH